MSRESLEDALHLWALNERNDLAALGYPKEAVYSKDYIAGYRQSAPPAQADLDVLGLIERGISELRKDSSSQYMVLVAYYHADAARPVDRAIRIKQYLRSWGITKRVFDDRLRMARRYLQGVLDIYHA